MGAAWPCFILKKNTPMDIDITSVIISAVAFSFFLIPIIYDQWKNKT
ncbi:hypothetical protein SAMN06265218_1225 [Fodinibius sediminis]|uniref:Uncharacterized protein n=1 Tax=Fodinibius sediminis TaxID=1214077 RepID=A0A521F424_9BACT|nr:hypothetical protein SAMN06265218_1225 [Fodinibius sediminis]